MKIIQWGNQYLLSHGYTLNNNTPEIVCDTPWSYVLRFITSKGYIYLKHTPELLALEARIIQILRADFHASVPKIIAHNAELNCFLMKDAGIPLRKMLKQQFDVTLLCKAIDQFAALQSVVADNVNVFLDIGVPDWRLDKLPDLYQQLLAQKKILIADGLSEMEINECEALMPTISDLCEKLSSYAIRQTIVQPDFHDNNILINEISKKTTLIDLGEITISHPFFSLINCLQQIKKHHALTDEDDAYQQIQNACLQHYMNVGSKKQLLDAFETAHTLSFVYGALCSDRLKIACDKARFTSSFQNHGRPSMSLKALMIACRA